MESKLRVGIAGPVGSGKTATAISTAEGLSDNMNITTILPASLEMNFINEIKKWGEELFDINNNNWIFISEKEIIKNTNFRKSFKNKYNETLEDSIQKFKNPESLLVQKNDV